MCWRSTWIIELTDEIYWVACGCTRVCNPCGCNRSFNYTDEMCWRVMWMYFTASHSTTRTIYNGDPCGCIHIVHAGQLPTRTIYTGGSCGCTCVVQAVHVLCRSFSYKYEECWGSKGCTFVQVVQIYRPDVVGGPPGCIRVVQVVQLHARDVLEVHVHVAVHVLCI